MDVSAAKTVDTLIQSMTATERTQEGVQVATLKNVLDAESENAAKLLEQLSGKGQIIDIRA